MSVFQEYYTAQEIADAAGRLKTKVVPHSKFRVLEMADRENWTASPLCRKRAGTEGGGGYEYHYTLLPVFLQDALQSEYLRGRRAVALVEAESRNVVVQEHLETSALSARQRQVMEARAGVVNEILRRCHATGCSQRGAILSFLDDAKQGALPLGIAALATRANDKGRGLSRGTIARWLAAREEGGLVALAPKKTRKKVDLPVWMKAFLQYYRTPQKLSVAHAYETWCRDNAGAQMPALWQVRHALAKLPEIDKQRGRMGSRELKSLKAYHARDASELLPATVYVADGKTFDAEVAHPLTGRPFKPEITTIIDARTRRIVGWSVALAENAHAVIDALLMAAATAGVPAIFYSDNGPGYKNDKMENALTGFLERLGITSMHAIAYNSQAKGVIERFNRHWTTLSRELPTYIGRDMDKQAAQFVHKTTRKEIAETNISTLLPSWSQFMDVCAAMIERYNSRPHRGLDKVTDTQTGKRRHMTPSEVWEQACPDGWQPPVIDVGEIAELRQPWVVRKTRRALVEWLDNAYFAIELEKHHGQDVIVAYDIHNANEVTVREISLDADGERQPGPVIAVARFNGHKTRFIPLTYERDAMEKRHKARKARVMKKADVIDAELRQMTIETYSAPVAPPMVEAPRPVLVAEVETPTAQQTETTKFHAANKRPNFRSDAEYAVWLLENPEKINSRDSAYICEDLLSTETMMDFLRRQGVDLPSLAKLAQSAAA